MLKNDILNNIGLPGSTDTTVISFVNLHLQTRYEDLLAAFSSWPNQTAQNANTVAAQQYYHNPPGIVKIESVVILQGQIAYPLKLVNSQQEWNYINQYPNIQVFIPQFYFPRRDDFGVWPTPQAIYPMTVNYIYRDRNLNVTDYIAATVTFTNNSQSIVGSGTVFTSDMIGRFIVPTDTDGFPTGYWYRITAVTDTTHLTIETFYEGATAIGSKYLIGQTPELPEEAHILLSWGVTADWYIQRGDMEKAARFNNLYYTGDGNNAERGGKSVLGGLYGVRERYAERGDRRIITMNKKGKIGFYPEWINRII